MEQYDPNNSDAGDVSVNETKDDVYDEIEARERALRQGYNIPDEVVLTEAPEQYEDKEEIVEGLRSYLRRTPRFR